MAKRIFLLIVGVAALSWGSHNRSTHTGINLENSPSAVVVLACQQTPDFNLKYMAIVEPAFILEAPYTAESIIHAPELLIGHRRTVAPYARPPNGFLS